MSWPGAESPGVLAGVFCSAVLWPAIAADSVATPDFAPDTGTGWLAPEDDFIAPDLFRVGHLQCLSQRSGDLFPVVWVDDDRFPQLFCGPCHFTKNQDSGLVRPARDVLDGRCRRALPLARRRDRDRGGGIAGAPSLRSRCLGVEGILRHATFQQHGPQRLHAQHSHRLAGLERGRAEVRCEHDVFERQ